MQWDLPPQAWIEFFTQIRSENFLFGTSPVTLGSIPTSDDFYEADYCGWISG